VLPKKITAPRKGLFIKTAPRKGFFSKNCSQKGFFLKNCSQKDFFLKRAPSSLRPAACRFFYSQMITSFNLQHSHGTDSTLKAILIK